MAGSDLPKPAASPKRNRNEFVRENIPASERVASAVLLCLILGIGVGLWIKGKHFDPNRYALRTDALKSTAGAVEGKAGTLRSAGETQPGEEGASAAPRPKAEAATAEAEPAEGAAAAPKPAIKGEPLEIALPGLKPMGATEFYSSDNLFEKIDGRAPAYQGFNVQQLRSRSFSVNALSGSFVDVYEFRFDSPVNAFGMFALERDPKGKPLDFAPDGYAGEMGWFFRQGAVYVQVIASDQKPETLALAVAIAQNRAKQLPADDAGLAGRRKLPAEGLIADSIAFVPDNAQGQAFLKNVYQANYNFAGGKLSFFVMVTGPGEAAAAWKSYLDFSGQFGGKATVLPDASGAKLFAAENFGTAKVIYQREGEIGGVVDVPNGELARQFVEKYLAGQIK